MYVQRTIDLTTDTDMPSLMRLEKNSNTITYVHYIYKDVTLLTSLHNIQFPSNNNTEPLLMLNQC